MTSPYVFTDQATRSVLDILTSPDDLNSAHLDPAQLPPALPPSTPPLAADIPGGALSFGDYVLSPSLPRPPQAPGSAAPPPLSGGYAGYAQTPAEPPSMYSAYGAGYKPLIMPGPPGARPPTAPGAAVAPGTGQPYVFPAKQPKPGEFRILKELGPSYKEQNEKALNELKRRDELKLPKDNAVVRYLNDRKREKYRVTMGSVITRNGVPFDTAKTKRPYLAKSGGFMMAWMSDEQKREWGYNGLIWVCVGDPKGTEKPSFFTHVGKPDRFHHSSFNRGQGVIGAGEWIIKEGALAKVSATSGHYQPTIDFLYHAVLQMAVAFRDQGALGGTTILLFDKTSVAWIDYPVKDFIKAPTAGGRLSTHPNG